MKGLFSKKSYNPPRRRIANAYDNVTAIFNLRHFDVLIYMQYR